MDANKIQKLIDDFRFQIVDTQGVQRSDTWTIRQNSSEDSVFVYSRGQGQKMKLSLHPRNISDDGNDSQWGIKNKYKEGLELKGFSVPRAVRWKRPYDKLKTKRVATILFPSEYLTGEVYQFVKERKPKVNIPLANEGKATEVSIFYSYNNQNPDVVAEHLYKNYSYTPVFYLTFSTGEIASVVIREVPFDKTIIPKNGSYSGHKLSDEKITGSKFIHLLLFNHPKDGEFFQLCEINGVDVKI